MAGGQDARQAAHRLGVGRGIVACGKRHEPGGAGGGQGNSLGDEAIAHTLGRARRRGDLLHLGAFRQRVQTVIVGLRGGRNGCKPTLQCIEDPLYEARLGRHGTGVAGNVNGTVLRHKEGRLRHRRRMHAGRLHICLLICAHEWLPLLIFCLTSKFPTPELIMRGNNKI